MTCVMPLYFLYSNVLMTETIKCGGEGNIQIMMNYALFLVHLHRGDEAIPTLKEIIAREYDLPVELSGYSEGAIMFIYIAEKNRDLCDARVISLQQCSDD